LTAARAIDDKWERAEALARVAQTAVRGIDDATSRARALAEVTQQLGATQMSDLIRQEWMETVRVLSMRRRGDCIEGMTTVLPLIDAVGGETVVRSLGQSIVSVGKWWP